MRERDEANRTDRTDRASGAGEILDLVDESGKVLGQIAREKVHGHPEYLHPVVHLHILNRAGEILLQKRAATKQVQPERWDTAVGGHIISGESLEEALVSECREELGLDPAGAQYMFQYIHSNYFESELIYAWLLFREGPFEPDPEEVSEVRFWALAEIEANLGREDLFTPNFMGEFPKVRDFLGRHYPGLPGF